jgi:type II restriction/modification system DNA methylase subunit YeeA
MVRTLPKFRPLYLGFQRTSVRRLTENEAVAFVGGQKDGPFEISGELARRFLAEPTNPNGKRNSDVVRPWLNGRDLARRPSDTWIVDFGTLAEREATFYEAPFQYVRTHVSPHRQRNRDQHRKTFWWLHGRPASKAKTAILHLNRMIVTPLTSKHRWFVFADKLAFPDNSVVIIARDDYCTLGILSSSFHSRWSFQAGNFIGVGNDPRYTPTTTFGTFPFPEGLTPDLSADLYANDPRAIQIAERAQELDARRRAWLNPAELVCTVPEVVTGYGDRVIPRDAAAALQLQERTLTRLYNESPQWLSDIHSELDKAVAAAYGWPEDILLKDALANLVALNLARPSMSHSEVADEYDGLVDAEEMAEGSNLANPADVHGG